MIYLTVIRGTYYLLNLCSCIGALQAEGHLAPINLTVMLLTHDVQ